MNPAFVERSLSFGDSLHAPAGHALTARARKLAPLDQVPNNRRCEVECSRPAAGIRLLQTIQIRRFFNGHLVPIIRSFIAAHENCEGKVENPSSDAPFGWPAIIATLPQRRRWLARLRPPHDRKKSHSNKQKAKYARLSAKIDYN